MNVGSGSESAPQTDAHLLVPYTSAREHALEACWGQRAQLASCPVGRPLAYGTPETPWFSRCGLNSCLYCLRGKSWHVGDAIRFVQPTALITLTGMSDDHRTNRELVNGLKRSLTRTGLDFGWLWVTEWNPRGTGAHTHAWLRGDIPGPGTLQLHADRAGLGITLIKQVTYDGDFEYICKTAVWNHESLTAYRQLNGTELVHGGPGFWRDPETGEPIDRKTATSRYRAMQKSRQTGRALVVRSNVRAVDVGSEALGARLV